MRIRIGTRRSRLAKTQTTHVADALRAHGIESELVEIESSGDVDRTTPLYAIEPESPGLFTKQLEAALLDGRVDLAVHSLKDLPTTQPPELRIAAIPPRVEPGDLLLRRPGAASDLPLGLARGARVGTSSLRREAQLLAVRPDLKIVPIRGNVPTRVEKARSGEVDAVVLAEAGLTRLQLALEGVEAVPLTGTAFVAAPGQGALALETRREIPSILEAALRKVHDPISELETRVERRILQELHGGCTLPLGARCRRNDDGSLTVQAFLGVAKRRGATPREWLGFHHLEEIDRDEAKLIAKVVAVFAEKLRETR